VKALAGFVGGELVAIAGLALSRGRVVAFADLKPEAKQHRFALHRAAVRVMADARRQGHKVIFATPDLNEPTARRWLQRLGFSPVDDEGKIWLWQA